MYYFIFYFVYKIQTRQSDFTPFLGRFMASLIVLITCVMHIGMFYAFVRYILFNYYGIWFFDFLKNPVVNYFSGIPTFALFFIIIFKFFTYKRIDYIVEKYQNKRIFSFFNIIKFFSIIFMPLVIAIILVNHSIAK